MIFSSAARFACRALACALAVSLAACGGGGGGGGEGAGAPNPPPVPPPGAAFTSVSSTLWHDAQRDTLWLLSPDDARLVKLDANSLEQLAWFPLEQSPMAMSAAAGYLVIALQTGVQRFDIAREVFAPAIAVPCGDPHGVVTSVTAATAWLSCINEDLLVEVALEGAAAIRLLQAQKPAGIALVGEQLRVSQAVGGAVTVVPLTSFAGLPAWGLTDPSPAPARAPAYRADAEGNRSISQFNSLAADAGSGELVGAYQLVDNLGDRSRPPSQGGYGSVFDGQPRIEPRLVAACGDRYARFDGGVRVFSGPAALALADGLLWVVHEYTRNVAVLRCPPAQSGQWPADAASGELPLVAHFTVGDGARGIVLDAGGRTAWVDNSFDHSVSKLVVSEQMLAAGNVFANPELQRVRDTGQFALSGPALAGRSLFFDATNIQLTPSGIVTCATCHPRAGSDGLQWFIHTSEIPRKFRNTAPAWAARSDAAPFHWAGDFDDAPALTRNTIRGLMEGDAILVDNSAIAAYMNEAPAPTAVPVPAWQQAAREQGQAIFQARCSACHAGPSYSDRVAHRVVEDSMDPDGVMAAVDTPSLIAVRATAPYLHDGRALTLEEVLLTHNPDGMHGQVSDLGTGDIGALILFLKSL